MPCNRDVVYRREISTLNKLKREPDKLQKCIESMKSAIEAGHVEVVPEDESNSKDVWYLPLFPVTHKRKEKLRLVYDSASTYQNVSLNSVLLQGPDTVNRLRSVITKFRENNVAFAADIESMFNSFYVIPKHRDFMRFFWLEHNNPDGRLVEYRALTHIFGNCSSPAVATICLREAADRYSLHPYDERVNNTINEAKYYIKNGFYVDDGLSSTETPAEAIDILCTARQILGDFNIHLHKIVCNVPIVLEAFPESECALSREIVEFDEEPTQHTLGVAWSIKDDYFIVRANLQNKPFTKRGILSLVNATFDPIGIVSPVILKGRLIQRLILSPHPDERETLSKFDWDDILPDKYKEAFNQWLKSLDDLKLLRIPRCIKPLEFGCITQQTLHVFCDASTDAIGHVIYCKSKNQYGASHVAFMFGESKVSPRGATSIPRLELNAAVDAAISAQKVSQDMKRKPDAIYYYTDSNVLLGYLNNESTRFARYVSRRIDIILGISVSSQWNYVSTTENPADIASRPHEPISLLTTTWLQGPSFLNRQDVQQNLKSNETDVLPETVSDQGITLLISCNKELIFQNLFHRKNSWTKIINTCKYILQIARRADRAKQNLGVHLASRNPPTEKEAKILLIKEAQATQFTDIINLLANKDKIPISHKMLSLAPFLDKDMVLRVGGRLQEADIAYDIKHPILIPYSHPISNIIIDYYHKKSQHQGRHITSSAIRAAGFYLERERHAVRHFLGKCTMCRKLRGAPENQLMANLPMDRTEPTPPFTNTGLDVFGHWFVREGLSTRRNASLRKVWAVLFTCLSSRAVHIEVLASMDTPTFINALRRFFSIRGPCKIIRSDRGSNFIGATNQEIHLNLESIQTNLNQHECKWIFNPPYASHFGGVWERKIGQVRNILNAILMQESNRTLTKDELHTFLCEAAYIINSTPLWVTSTDPNDIMPISPNLLLSLKSNLSAENQKEFTNEDKNAYGVRRWRYIQFLSDQFWHKYKSFYLTELQKRTKFNKVAPSLCIGDVVLIRDRNSKRINWPMGVIEKTKTSSDGHVRSVTIKKVLSKNNSPRTVLCERPIHEVVLLQKRDTERVSVCDNKAK